MKLNVCQASKAAESSALIMSFFQPHVRNPGEMLNQWRPFTTPEIEIEPNSTVGSLLLFICKGNPRTYCGPHTELAEGKSKVR